MVKYIHENRDTIHNFIYNDSDERKVIDSLPVQRLRHIHQLSLTYLLYPAATHKRFEHSLGVMELAGRVFDVVSKPDNITDEIKKLLPEIGKIDELKYWRKIIRIAGLCHDLGHLPFSHAAEKELLPEGWSHERLTYEIILSDEISHVLQNMTQPIRPEAIARIAVGPKKFIDKPLSLWETILSEIITGGAFGVDRMDYLLRDSHHIGVAYGRFDHYRLIDTLRILPQVKKEDKDTEEYQELSLGIQSGGIHSAEALLLARYFMYSQVYFHHIRRIYDDHLKEFLSDWLETGKFSIDIKEHQNITDNEVLSAMRIAAKCKISKGDIHAWRIINHKHFRKVYEYNPEDIRTNPDVSNVVYSNLIDKYGENNVRFLPYHEKDSSLDYPVQENDGRISSFRIKSRILQYLPTIDIDHVFVNPDIFQEVDRWLKSNLHNIIKPKSEV